MITFPITTISKAFNQNRSQVLLHFLLLFYKFILTLIKDNVVLNNAKSPLHQNNFITNTPPRAIPTTEVTGTSTLSPEITEITSDSQSSKIPHDFKQKLLDQCTSFSYLKITCL